MDHDHSMGDGQQIVSRAFRFAGWNDGIVRPVHVPWALSEVPGPIGAALTSCDGRSLAAVMNTGREDRPSSAMTSYHLDELQSTAHLFAESRGEAMSAAHLFLAVIDHGEAEATAQLDGLAVDTAALRLVALEVLAAPRDLPPIAAVDVTPAGSAAAGS